MNIGASESTTIKSDALMHDVSTQTEESQPFDIDSRYQLMIWWRGLCKSNGVNWITTQNEYNIEQEARMKGVPLRSCEQCTGNFHKFLLQMATAKLQQKKELVKEI